MQKTSQVIEKEKHKQQLQKTIREKKPDPEPLLWEQQRREKKRRMRGLYETRRKTTNKIQRKKYKNQNKLRIN